MIWTGVFVTTTLILAVICILLLGRVFHLLAEVAQYDQQLHTNHKRATEEICRWKSKAEFYEAEAKAMKKPQGPHRTFRDR